MDYTERNGENIRHEGLENNFNLENWAPERDSKNIGNRVVLSSETEAEEDPLANDLGQIIDLPSPAQSRVDDQSDTSAEVSRNLQSIIGSHFSDAVMTEISRAENELSQTENVSNFYDEIRDMAEIARGSWAA